MAWAVTSVVQIYRTRVPSFPRLLSPVLTNVGAVYEYVIEGMKPLQEEDGTPWIIKVHALL